MKKINEIFYNIQGEGYYTGVPAIFIRFSGCNLNCEFCDTDHSLGKIMSDEEILDIYIDVLEKTGKTEQKEKIGILI